MGQTIFGIGANRITGNCSRLPIFDHFANLSAKAERVKSTFAACLYNWGFTHPCCKQ
jgi:hypothetical protein